MSSSGKKAAKPRPYVPPIPPHLFRDPKARRNAWAVLQTKEQIANAALCKMRTEMNTLLPISLLPIEVLCKIFAIAAAIDPMIVSTLRYYPLSARRKIGWIKVSHVCRSWREAALGCPTLWTNVPLHGGAFWRNAFLARSRAAAIDVTAPKVDREWYSVSTILSEHLHRVRKLSASIQNQNDLGFLSSPAPLLEHFDIDCFNNGSVPLTFPKLFSGHAPRLTSVSISQPPAFPVHPTLYANVYKFAINRDISDRDTFLIPSVFDFFSTLQSMSRITDLQLNGCLPAVPGPPWPEHTLHLPHLSHLELKGPIAHVSGVLDQVRLSQLCTLRVVCEMANDNMMDVHDVPPFLRALCRTGLFGSGQHRPREAFVVRALSVSSHAQDCLEVNAWPTPHCVDECSALIDQRNSLFSLSFQWPEGQSGSHSVVGKLVCQSVPLDELEVLAVHSLLLGWTPEIWKTIFDRCAKVRSVHSVHGDAISLFHALFPHTQPEPEGHPNEVLFPSLSSISAFNVNFYAPVMGISAEPVRDWLRRLFQARRGVGHPIAKLQAGKQNSTLDWADGLRDVVSVEWAMDHYGRDIIFSSAEAMGTSIHDEDGQNDGNGD